MTEKSNTPFTRPNLQDARKNWEESMLRQVEELRRQVSSLPIRYVAERCGSSFHEQNLCLRYWGQEIEITWPTLEARRVQDGQVCSVHDQAMLMYYLHTADGAPMADRWAAFRELPGGTFYHQAFQGYSGDLLARHFGSSPEAFIQAARALGGDPLTGISEHAYAFLPFPRIRLAAVLWPGDEEFPARGSILFDAHACHYTTIDGCALLGSRLANRLINTSKDL